MTTYHTGNAIGSADPRDLYDNAENLDEFVNSPDKLTHPDRLGVPRKTWHGMERDFQAFLLSSGYQGLGDYAPGIEITARNQVIRADGELWRISASVELPYTTTGAGMPEGGAFVSVGDAVLRQELAGDVADGQGAMKVRGAVIYVDTITELLELEEGDLSDGHTASVMGSEFRWNANASEWVPVGYVNAEAFGSTGADVKAAIESGYREIYIGREFDIGSGIECEASDVSIFGPGALATTGDGLRIVGDNVSIHGITVKSHEKSTTPTMVYNRAGIAVIGDNVSVSSVDVYNIDGTGIELAGRNVSVTDSVIRDNITGIRLTARVRKASITGNRIVDNNVNDASGASGILGHRSCQDITISENFILNNGEHGLYFQGQGAIITDNHVGHNARDGLKFGSYNDDLYEYDGEVLDLWVGGSEYGMKNILIQGNYIYDNLGEDGIYFQPSSKEVLVVGNILENNRIRWVYFNYTGEMERLEDHYNITIRDNVLTGSDGLADISVAAHAGVSILGNRLDGNIYLSAPNSATEPRLSGYQTDALVSSNVANQVRFTRQIRPKCLSNDMQKMFIDTNCSEAEVRDCRISAQDEPLDTARIAVFSSNMCEVVGDVAFSGSGIPFGFPKEFLNNTIKGNDFTGSYFIAASFNANLPIRGVFQGNTIEAPSSSRPVRIWSVDSLITGNTILGSTSADRAIEVQGARNCVTGNNARYGSIVTPNENEGHVVVGNRANVGGSTTGNTVASNG